MAVRDDAQIAVLRNGDRRIIGLLPFQASESDLGEPIGGRMNDYHGIIAPNPIDLEVDDLLRGLRLRQFKYHALATSVEPFRQYAFETLTSYSIDLSIGSRDYFKWLNRHSSTIHRLPQKIRSLARSFGDFRFEFDSTDSQALERVIELKRSKFRSTNTFDILSVPWTADLIRQIFQQRDPECRGLLSLLWAGDRLVAGHFGMVSRKVLLYWFPAYDEAYSRFSPGLQLMLQTCRHAAESGIERIDMSYGDSVFKDKFCNRRCEVLLGCACPNFVTYQILKNRYRLRQQLKKIPFKGAAKYLLRRVFPGYGRWHFR
jgi:CelD/BcsL family acetyltransferase involved in cellulose biosynthesis